MDMIKFLSNKVSLLVMYCLIGYGWRAFLLRLVFAFSFYISYLSPDIKPLTEGKLLFTIWGTSIYAILKLIYDSTLSAEEQRDDWEKTVKDVRKEVEDASLVSNLLYALIGTILLVMMLLGPLF